MSSIKLVIFDCDGVLVDSETIACRIFAQMLRQDGFEISDEESLSEYAGLSDRDALLKVESRFNRKLADDFNARCSKVTLEALNRELQPIPGIVDALQKISTLKCVASGSSPIRLQQMLTQVGIIHHFNGSIFSATMVKRGKPDPDIFLLAADKMGVAAKDCLVVEDSRFGVQAARSAGMRVLGYVPYGNGTELQQLGAKIFRSMSELPALCLG